MMDGLSISGTGRKVYQTQPALTSDSELAKPKSIPKPNEKAHYY